MRILVIGSGGFIGSHVVRFFSIKPGIECLTCDIDTGIQNRIDFVLDKANADFIQVFTKGRIDVCINCSGAANVPDSFKNPYLDFSLNTINVARILEAIRTCQPGCHMINLSSAALYGNPASLPVNEAAPVAPLSPYGYHKWMAEKLCEDYHRHFGIKTVSLRIFSAYGPGLRKQLLWDIYQKSLNSDRVELSGTGTETRDFIYIDDITEAIYKVATAGAFNAGIYNIAGGCEISINELAVTLLNCLNYSGELVFNGIRRSGDPVNWQADISLMRALGFNPEVSLEEGVRKYADWLINA